MPTCPSVQEYRCGFTSLSGEGVGHPYQKKECGGVYFGQKMKLRSGSKDGQEKKIAPPGSMPPTARWISLGLFRMDLETEF